MGSLCAARRIASRASGSETPASSNMTRPGLTTATQPSGEPLPEPMRVSAGFFVTGLSGNTLIHTLPPRLILRVIATRAASICRLLSQPPSSALSPYSPNWTFTCPRDMPARRPRCCLRCFTRLGESISAHLPASSGRLRRRLDRPASTFLPAGHRLATGRGGPRRRRVHARGPRGHRAREGALHRAAERDPVLQLLGDRLSHQRGVELGALDLEDVDLYLLVGHAVQLPAQGVDFAARLADHDARAGGVDVDLQFARVLADRDVRQARVGELAHDVLADAHVLG